MSTFCFLIPLFLFFWKINRSQFLETVSFLVDLLQILTKATHLRGSVVCLLCFDEICCAKEKPCFLSHRHTMQLKLLNLRRPFCFSSSYVACVRTVYFPPVFPAPSFSRAFKFVFSTKTAPYFDPTTVS